MVLLEDELFFETLEVIRENMKLPQIYIDLKAFLKEKYQITAINFEFRQIESQSNRGRLTVIVSSEKEYKSILSEDGWNFDPKIQREIAREFAELARRYGLFSEENLKSIYVYYCDFSSEIKTYIGWSAEREIKETLIDKYRKNGVWKIETPLSQVYVFYNTNREIVENIKNGISEKIKEDCWAIVKKYDEFSYFKDNSFVKFESKENLDKNYEGSLFLYFQ